MLLKTLPVKEPERLVLFRSMSPPEFSPGSYSGYSIPRPGDGANVMTSFPYQSFCECASSRADLSDVFAFGDVSLSVNADGQVDVASGQAVSRQLFRRAGRAGVLGRTLTDEDDQAAAQPRRRAQLPVLAAPLRGRPAVIGKQINLNNVAFTVVGVTPPGFEGTMQVGSTRRCDDPNCLGAATVSRTRKARG